uniref:MYND-type domain-containing protein n=1 Tax=Stegastes partitus TaxID=144197 RepID=A0A3B5A357_9TELE
MLSTTCGGVAADAIREGASSPFASASEKRQGLGVQEWLDGSRYEGEFVNGLKHGRGRYTWINGESYEGSFYKDYKHGDALYCWPTGHKFIGKFYLNRKEGYGHSEPLLSSQGLYHNDQRFGPGVVSYSDGRQDVGLWLGGRLLRFCTPLEEGFSLKNFPEYAACMDSSVTADPLTQVHLPLLPPQVNVDKDLLANENAILPPGIESYSTDGDHLPLPPGRRRELDQLFYGELWEPDAHPHQGCERDPLSTLPLQARMQAHIHKHRLQAENVGWDVAAALSMNRETFGPKGPLEVRSELLIQHASQGELQAVSQILRTGLIHPDVTDSQGHTALIAATVNCHNDVIHLLLDMGADIDKLTCEGLSALAVCHVLYYPFKSLNTALVDPPAKTPKNSQNTSHLRAVKCPLTVNSSQSAGLAETKRLQKLNIYRRRREKRKVERLKTVRRQKEREKKGALRRMRKTSFDSACSLSSYNIQVTEEMMQRSAEALSRTGFPQCADTQGTVRKMAAMKIEHRVRLDTLKLLLERGADPNAARVPLLVLFLAIMAADTEAVRRLLLCGARTDIPLPPEKKGLYPLHVAAALPGPTGPRITELLLHTVPDPDARACDQDEVYEPDRVCISMKTEEPLSSSKSPHLKEGGRTALHVACQRDSDYNASKVVALLVSHSASTDLLWSGHSPLSLAIASGNELAVEELLKGGADPSIPLGRRVGSALCAVANINYHLGGNKIQLVQTDTHTLICVDENVSQTDFCYHCGRSVSVKLTACCRCHKVFHCSMNCKHKAWDEGHKEDFNEIFLLISHQSKC